MKILFFGTPAFAAEFLQGLLAEPSFEIVGVVTQPDEPVGRKKILTPPPVKQLALEHSLPVFQPVKLKDPDFQAQLAALKPDVAVVVAYGRLLPETVLELPRLGCVNVHPSKLPKYRGPSPIAAAIANGESETAVSIMQLVNEMDAGPIFKQVPLSIAADETTPSLTAKIVEVGAPALLETLHELAAGTAVATEQAYEQATFCKLMSRADGLIDWHESAEVIERKLRAYTPWPGLYTPEFKVFTARITNVKLPPSETSAKDGRLLIGTGSTAIEILELQPSSGKRMTSADYLRGRRL